MLPYPNIDPVIFGIGPLKIRWYGLMYVLGFMASYFLVLRQIKQFNFKKLASHFEDLNFILLLSLILGGRLGYVLFYNLPYYLQHPAEILATWRGGMSFHGALLAVIIGGVLFCKKNKLPFWRTADIYVVTVPIGLGLGRLGNFINGELFGRVTTVPWGMIFPAGGPLPRHPSQLYEFFLEGFILFIVLWKLKDRPHWDGFILACFLILYGIFRSFIEVFRQPDPQIGFLFGYLTMGQILSFLMILAGGLIILWRRNCE
ncbi:MAG: prolipoprotein diacylglyceryl transferase [Deltaproteobacteria bacterium]|nr:prolipoprotein diacylglyceryl transferase [Deltaproteobacteria bacterium]